jgi:hypothetical protein
MTNMAFATGAAVSGTQRCLLKYKNRCFNGQTKPKQPRRLTSRTTTSGTPAKRGPIQSGVQQSDAPNVSKIGALKTTKAGPKYRARSETEQGPPTCIGTNKPCIQIPGTKPENCALAGQRIRKDWLKKLKSFQKLKKNYNDPKY